jgi:diadenosine tetraphosphate (Ap4A) HIT family hydrolase
MAEGTAPHATLKAFGYPESLVADTRHWAVLLRPKQATLGALALVCKGDATAFGAIGEDAFAELPRLVRGVEDALGRAFAYDKINYLMLMMVDPQVHFHVLPRYGRTVEFDGVPFPDRGWPGQPDLGHAPDLSPAQRKRLRDHLRAHWSGGPSA